MGRRPRRSVRAALWPPRLAIPWFAVLVALAFIALATLRWDAWVGHATIQTTNDAYVRAELTRLSSRVAGEVLTVAAKGPLAVLDGGRRSIPFDNVAHIIAQRHGSKQKTAIFTIEAPQPGFKLAWHTGRPYRAQLNKHALLVVRMKSTRPADFGF